MKTNSSTLTLITNAIADSRKPVNVAGSLYQGMSHPPKNSVTITAEIVAIEMYSLMKNSANFMDEYSV